MLRLVLANDQPSTIHRHHPQSNTSTVTATTNSPNPAPPILIRHMPRRGQNLLHHSSKPPLHHPTRPPPAKEIIGNPLKQSLPPLCESKSISEKLGRIECETGFLRGVEFDWRIFLGQPLFPFRSMRKILFPSKNCVIDRRNETKSVKNLHTWELVHKILALFLP